MATSSAAYHAYQAVVDVDTNAVSSELLIPKLICKQHRLAEKLKSWNPEKAEQPEKAKTADRAQIAGTRSEVLIHAT